MHTPQSSAEDGSNVRNSSHASIFINGMHSRNASIDQSNPNAVDNRTVSELQASIEEYEKTVIRYEEEISGLKDSINTLIEKNREKDMDISKLKEQITEQRTREFDYRIKEKEYKQAKALYSEIREKHAMLTLKYFGLQCEYDKVKGDYDDIVSYLSATSNIDFDAIGGMSGISGMMSHMPGMGGVPGISGIPDMSGMGGLGGLAAIGGFGGLAAPDMDTLNPMYGGGLSIMTNSTNVSTNENETETKHRNDNDNDPENKDNDDEFVATADFHRDYGNNNDDNNNETAKFDPSNKTVSMTDILDYKNKQRHSKNKHKNGKENGDNDNDNDNDNDGENDNDNHTNSNTDNEENGRNSGTSAHHSPEMSFTVDIGANMPPFTGGYMNTGFVGNGFGAWGNTPLAPRIGDEPIPDEMKSDGENNDHVDISIGFLGTATAAQTGTDASTSAGAQTTGLSTAQGSVSPTSFSVSQSHVTSPEVAVSNNNNNNNNQNNQQLSTQNHALLSTENSTNSANSGNSGKHGRRMSLDNGAVGVAEYAAHVANRFYGQDDFRNDENIGPNGGNSNENGANNSNPNGNNNNTNNNNNNNASSGNNNNSNSNSNNANNSSSGLQSGLHSTTSTYGSLQQIAGLFDRSISMRSLTNVPGSTKAGLTTAAGNIKNISSHPNYSAEKTSTVAHMQNKNRDEIIDYVVQLRLQLKEMRESKFKFVKSTTTHIETLHKKLDNKDKGGHGNPDAINMDSIGTNSDRPLAKLMVNNSIDDVSDDISGNSNASHRHVHKRARSALPTNAGKPPSFDTTNPKIHKLDESLVFCFKFVFN